MIELPRKDGTNYTLLDDEYRNLVKTYPQLNIRHELGKMRNWLMANPKKRKVDVERFVINWLNRAKPSPVGSIDPEVSGHHALVEERERPPDAPSHRNDAVAAREVTKLKKMFGMR